LKSPESANLARFVKDRRFNNFPILHLVKANRGGRGYGTP
jgi:hypothetical protein